MYQAVTIKIIFQSLVQVFTLKNIHKKIIKKLKENYFLNDRIFFFQSGRSALGYILEKLPKRKFIMIPSYSCEVVPLEVKKRGFIPLYYELNPNNDDNLEKKIKKNLKNTAAIIYQHSFGVHKNINSLKKFLLKKKVILIEDKALCFLSKDKKLPELQGDISYYSFESSKTITSTMGGMIYFNNEIFKNEIKYKNSLIYNLKTNLRVLLSMFSYKIPGDIGFAIRKFFILLNLIKPSVSKIDLDINLNKEFYDLTNFQKVLLLNQLKNIKNLKKNSEQNIKFWSKTLNFDFRKIFKKDFLPLRLYFVSKDSKKISKILKKNGLKQEDWFSGGVGDITFNHKSIDYKIDNFPETKEFCKNNINLPSIISINKKKKKNIQNEIRQIIK